jgi:type IV secretory pathway VirB3-like protein
MPTNFSYAVLSSLLIQIPVLLVGLVGIMLALVFWNRCPKAALLAIIAFAMFFVITLIDTYMSMTFSLVYARERAWTSAQLGVYFSIKSVVASVLRAVAYLLLLLAIFGWRNERRAGFPIQ